MLSSIFRFLGMPCLLMALVACEPAEQISTYTTERTAPPREPFDPAEMDAALDRMLTAMLPEGEQVYFFKMTGKAAAMGRHREVFHQFLATVGKGDSLDKPLIWQLPEGWTEKGSSDMRINTIVIPDSSGNLEIAVSSLPLSGSWDEFVTLNVNRWLGQLGQGELRRQTILNLTKKVPTQAGPATVIELAGVLRQTMPMNPHADMNTAGAASPPQASESSVASPPPATSPSSLEAPLTFDTPEGWQPGRVSAMRKAAFNIVDGSAQAEFTVIDLPSQGGAQITDVMANVQRWAAQVGLPIDDKLAELVETTKIDELEASYVNLVGPESANPRQAMLAAMVIRDDKVWFFKLVGPAALVERESENFNKFLASVRFK